MASWRIMVGGVVVIVLVSLGVATSDDKQTVKYKRQIFREQVLPHAGGKIPSDAFRADRLALNRLNKDGISVPDGVLLEARRHEKHPNLRPNTDLERSVIKIVLTPDGRYVPQEGASVDVDVRTVDSTYIIRQPIGRYKHEYRRFPKQKPHLPVHSKLELPNKEVSNPTVNKIAPIRQLPQSTSNHIDLSSIPGYGFPKNYAYMDNYDFFSDYMLPYYKPQAFPSFDPWFDGFNSDHDASLLRAQTSRKRKRVRFPTDKTPPAAPSGGFPPQRSPSRPNAASSQVVSDHVTPLGKAVFVCDDLARFREETYADSKSKCQAFHVCRKDGHRDTYECPQGTLFSNTLGRCDWWYNVACR